MSSIAPPHVVVGDAPPGGDVPTIPTVHFQITFGARNIVFDGARLFGTVDGGVTEALDGVGPARALTGTSFNRSVWEGASTSDLGPRGICGTVSAAGVVRVDTTTGVWCPWDVFFGKGFLGRVLVDAGGGKGTMECPTMTTSELTP